MSYPAVLERFLAMAEQAGAFEGVGLLAKAAVLRLARRDPERTCQHLDQLVELWLCARGQIPEEDHDARRTDHRAELGRAEQLGGHAEPDQGSRLRVPGRAPREDAGGGSAQVGAGVGAGASTRADEGARR